jgi:WD40 repeat protein
MRRNRRVLLAGACLIALVILAALLAMRWRIASTGVANTLWGHAAGITSLAFTADGATLASGSEDGTVKLDFMLFKHMLTRC